MHAMIGTTSLILALGFQGQPSQEHRNDPAAAPTAQTKTNSSLKQTSPSASPGAQNGATTEKKVGTAWPNSPDASLSSSQPGTQPSGTDPKSPSNEPVQFNPRVERFGVQTELADPAPEERPALQQTSSPQSTPGTRHRLKPSHPPTPPQKPAATDQSGKEPSKPYSGLEFHQDKPAGDLDYSLGSHYFIRAGLDQNPFLGHQNAQRRVLQRLRMAGELRWRHLGIKTELQDVRQWGDSPGTTNPGGRTRLYQGYLEFRAQSPAHRYRSFVRVGRQDIAVGEQRLVGKSSWNPNGRSFDAIRAFVELREMEMEAFWALIHSGRHAHPQNGQAIARTQLGALRLAYKAKPYLNGELLGLLHLAKATPQDPQGEEQIGNIGAHFWGLAVNRGDDRLSYDLEGNFQFGKRRGLSHRAWATAGRLRYLRSIQKFEVGVIAEVAAASGNRQDTKSREFFNFYPSNHRVYGMLDLLGWRNMMDLQFGLQAGYNGKINLNIDYHDLWLQSNKGRWSDILGRTLAPPLATGPTVLPQNDPMIHRRLGSEIDFRLTYRPAAPFFLRVGYGIFFPNYDANFRAGLPTTNRKPVGRAFLWMMATL